MVSMTEVGMTETAAIEMGELALAVGARWPLPLLEPCWWSLEEPSSLRKRRLMKVYTEDTARLLWRTHAPDTHASTPARSTHTHTHTPWQTPHHVRAHTHTHTHTHT